MKDSAKNLLYLVDLQVFAFAYALFCHAEITLKNWHQTGKNTIDPFSFQLLTIMLFYYICTPNSANLSNSMITHDPVKILTYGFKDELLQMV